VTIACEPRAAVVAFAITARPSRVAIVAFDTIAWRKPVDARARRDASDRCDCDEREFAVSEGTCAHRADPNRPRRAEPICLTAPAGWHACRRRTTKPYATIRAASARLATGRSGWQMPSIVPSEQRCSPSPRNCCARHLDRAERAGLIDKFYKDFDRRGTWTRLTRRGRELRTLALDILRRLDTTRPAGSAYGIRSYLEWYSPDE